MSSALRITVVVIKVLRFEIGDKEITSVTSLTKVFIGSIVNIAIGYLTNPTNIIIQEEPTITSDTLHRSVIAAHIISLTVTDVANSTRVIDQTVTFITSLTSVASVVSCFTIGD